MPEAKTVRLEPNPDAVQRLETYQAKYNLEGVL